MYTKPIIYKIYSFVLAAASVIAIGSAIYSFILLAPEIFNPFGFMSIVYTLAYIVGLAFTVWFAYLEFTMMFTFADMVKHELKEDGTLFKRRLAPSGKKYRLSGSIVFYAVLMIMIVTVIILVISSSIELGAFISVPVIPLLIVALIVFLVHVIFNCRYNTFGAVLDIKETDDPKIPEQNRLKETNPNTLRAFCVILFVLCAAVLVGTVYVCIAESSTLACALGIPTWLAVVIYICSGLISIVEMAIMGCFFDNLARMQEHYMIKYKLI